MCFSLQVTQQSSVFVEAKAFSLRERVLFVMQEKIGMEGPAMEGLTRKRKQCNSA